MALRILQDIGVRVDNENARVILKQAGAIVDDDSNIVQLPPDLIDLALESAPSDIYLYEASGREMPCRAGVNYMGTQGYAANFYDPNQDRLRTPDENDVAQWARLADYLSDVRIVQPITQNASMKPVESALRMARTVVLNTRKHYLAQPLEVEEAEIWFDLSNIIAQGDEVKRKGLVTFMATCISPYQLDATNTALLMLAAQREIPVAFFSGALAGATGPVTLAGILAQQNAEVLFALVLSQLTKPEAPFIYGMASSIIDLRSGNSLYAPIEYSLLKVASGQLSRYYHLPFYSALSMADSASIDVQNGAEKALTVLLTLLSGANFTSGGGNLATASTAAYEQLVIDHEIYRMVKRFVRGIEISEETLAWDAFLRVGIGGSFLSDKHTIDWMRSGEHFLPHITNRNGVRGESMLKRAHSVVEHVLSDHQVNIPDTVVDEVNTYVNKRLSQLV